MSDRFEHTQVGIGVAIIIAIAYTAISALMGNVWALSERSLDLLAMGIAVAVFSVLPDIDNKNALVHSDALVVSGLAGLVGLVLGLTGKWWGWLLLVIGALAFIWINYKAKDSWDHRSKPHTIWFGLVASVLYTLLFWIVFGVFSWLGGFTAFAVFISHLRLDKII